jgi:serine protease Do
VDGSTFLAALGGSSAELATRLRHGTVEIRSNGGNGSGTIWRKDGLIVTNNHVAQGERLAVVTDDDRVLEGKVVARDRERDLAAVRLDATSLPALNAGDSRDVRAGQLVFAAGNPWGRRGVITAGVLIGKGRSEELPLPEQIRADIELAPGNSGGPLTDATGLVIGINSMVAGRMAVAVPVHVVESFLAEALVRRTPGILGIELAPVALPSALLPAAQSRQALIVTGVAEDGPAWRAGILPGDILIAAGSNSERPDLVGSLGRVEAGVPFWLRVLRSGALREVEVLPEARAA